METEYRGWRIVECDIDVESMGFRMTRTFRVLDEFDDPMPINHGSFWSPADARQAIDFVEDVFKLMRGKKWPTSKTHEFNLAMAYRSQFVAVYETLQKIKKAAQDAQEMGDDPSADVLRLLDTLYQRCVVRPASGAASP